MTDNDQFNESRDPKTDQHTNHTTFDLSQEAKKALEMYRLGQQAQKQQESALQDAEQPPDTDDLKRAPLDNTTYDIAEEAARALEMHRLAHAAASVEDEAARFTQEMVVQLEIVGSQQPLVLDVRQEMIVGRSDDATDYMPEIDMTPYGAYRLGVSRRHALLSRHHNRLNVTDLGSRNGTAINGKMLGEGEMCELRHGDQVRFGTLKMRVTFHTKR